MLQVKKVPEAYSRIKTVCYGTMRKVIPLLNLLSNLTFSLNVNS